MTIELTRPDVIHTDYTADEILAAFEAHEGDDDFDEVWHEGPSRQRIKRDENGQPVVDVERTAKYSWTSYVHEDAPFLLRGEPVEVKIVDRTGGEDEGSGASVTFSIGSQYFKKSGYYASHYGYDWDGDFREVKAIEKTIVVFE